MFGFWLYNFWGGQSHLRLAVGPPARGRESQKGVKAASPLQFQLAKLYSAEVCTESPRRAGLNTHTHTHTHYVMSSQHHKLLEANRALGSWTSRQAIKTM